MLGLSTDLTYTSQEIPHGKVKGVMKEWRDVFVSVIQPVSMRRQIARPPNAAAYCG